MCFVLCPTLSPFLLKCGLFHRSKSYLPLIFFSATHFCRASDAYLGLNILWLLRQFDSTPLFSLVTDERHGLLYLPICSFIVFILSLEESKSVLGAQKQTILVKRWATFCCFSSLFHCNTREGCDYMAERVPRIGDSPLYAMYQSLQQPSFYSFTLVPFSLHCLNELHFLIHGCWWENKSWDRKHGHCILSSILLTRANFSTSSELSSAFKSQWWTL